MCRLSLLVAAVGLVLAAGSASAAHRSGFWGSRYCKDKLTAIRAFQFSTFQSCLASVSGTLSSCGINPQYAAYARRTRRDKSGGDDGEGVVC